MQEYDDLDYLPPANHFDAVYTPSIEDELGFINFKKIGKKLKKAGKGIKKGVKKAAKWAVTKSPVAKVTKFGAKTVVGVAKGTGKFIQKNKKLIKTGVALAAGGVALAVGGAPLLAAGKAVGGKMLGIGAGLLKGGQKAAVSATQLAAPHVKQMITANVDAKMQQAVNRGESVGESPQFQEAVEKLGAQGMNDQQIAQQWLTSQAYYKQAVPAVQQAIEPQLYADYSSAGYDEPQARFAAGHDSAIIAKETVKDVQAKAGGLDAKTILPIAAAIGAAAMLKG